MYKYILIVIFTLTFMNAQTYCAGDQVSSTHQNSIHLVGAGYDDYEAGDIVDTDQETGILLVGMNKAQEIKPEDKTEPQKKEKKLFKR